MIYAFDQYRVDTSTHELTRNGQPVTIETQPFAALVALIESRDTVLSRDDLIAVVWNGRLTSDAAIASLIKKVRRAIGDDGRAQRFVRTVHGVGFRFVGELQGTAGNARPALPSEDQRQSDRGTVLDTRPTLLVTPLATLQPGADATLPMGLTHDIIVGLSRLRWLKVIAWASAMQLRPATSSTPDLRTLTAADYSLDGEIEKRGEGIVLNCRLTKLADGTLLWAERLEGQPGDFNLMREQIVQQAVLALELQISSAEANRARYLHTEDVDAWGNYHLGLMHMYRFTAMDNARATQHFERAVALQPEFARAHAGLSFAHFQSAFNRYPGTDEDSCRGAARRHAEQGVSLDDRDPLVNFVMGRSFWLEGALEDSQPWLERALTLNSSFAQAYYSHGLAAVMLDGDAGACPESHDEASAAIALSPLDPFMYGFYGVRALSLLRDGHLEQGRFWANRAARQPGAIVAMDFIAAAANFMDGDREQAGRWAARARQRSGNGDSEYFFRALPFRDGALRSAMEGAFSSIGLAPAS